MNMSITSRVEMGGAVIITVRGEIEHETAHAVHDAVKDALSRRRPALLYLDLELVTFMASGGVSALVASHRTAESRGTRLIVRNPSPFVLRLLRINGMQIMLT